MATNTISCSCTLIAVHMYAGRTDIGVRWRRRYSHVIDVLSYITLGISSHQHIHASEYSLPWHDAAVRTAAMQKTLQSLVKPQIYIWRFMLNLPGSKPTSRSSTADTPVYPPRNHSYRNRSSKYNQLLGTAWISAISLSTTYNPESSSDPTRPIPWRSRHSTHCSPRTRLRKLLPPKAWASPDILTRCKDGLKARR